MIISYGMKYASDFPIAANVLRKLGNCDDVAFVEEIATGRQYMLTKQLQNWVLVDTLTPSMNDMTSDTAKENSFVECVKKYKMTNPLEILNWYRNLYYKEEFPSERRIMAEAINRLFMKYKDVFNVENDVG